MPLVTRLFLASAAGLWLGMQRPHWLPWAMLLAATAGGVSRRLVHAVVAAAFLLSGVVGRDATNADRRCRARVLRTGQATVRLVIPLGRDGKGSGWMEEGCRLRVRILARGHLAPSGARVAVAGLFRRAGNGVAVEVDQLALVQGPSAVERLRARVSASIDKRFEEDGPLVRALVLAEQQDLSQELRATFADAGIIHMVSVSGLHVSIVAGALLAALAACRLSTRRAELGACLVLAAYVLFIAAPAPAVRSAGMFILTAAARWVQHPTSPWAIWAVGSGVSLVEPRLVTDLGWQLSVSGMAGLLASGSVVQRVAAGATGWRRTLAEGVVATAIATIVSAPIVAWTFGRISVIAVVTNLLAGPLFNVAQPLLFATVMLGWLEPVAAALGDAARGALGLITLVGVAGARVPLGTLDVAPTAFTASMLAVAAIGVLAACIGRPRQGAGVAALALSAALWRPLVPWGPGALEVHMIDVGQGDAIGVRTPRGRWMVIDAGGSWATGDAGRSTVAPYLRARGGRLVHLVLTHPHADHVGGAASLLAQVSADTLWDSGYPGTSPSYAATLEEARRQGIAWRRVVPGSHWSLDGVEVRWLAPDSAWVAGQDNPNEASVVLQVRYGETRFLFTGDAEAMAEERLVSAYGKSLRSDVLKAGHHGSQTSSTPAFLATVDPSLVLVSVGRGNDYGHPSRSVLRALHERGAHVLRTDDDGTIVLRSDGVHIRVITSDTTWVHSARPSGG